MHTKELKNPKQSRVHSHFEGLLGGPEAALYGLVDEGGGRLALKGAQTVDQRLVGRVEALQLTGHHVLQATRVTETAISSLESKQLKACTWASNIKYYF